MRSVEPDQCLPFRARLINPCEDLHGFVRRVFCGQFDRVLNVFAGRNVVAFRLQFDRIERSTRKDTEKNGEYPKHVVAYHTRSNERSQSSETAGLRLNLLL